MKDFSICPVLMFQREHETFSILLQIWAAEPWTISPLPITASRCRQLNIAWQFMNFRSSLPQNPKPTSPSPSKAKWLISNANHLRQCAGWSFWAIPDCVSMKTTVPRCDISGVNQWPLVFPCLKHQWRTPTTLRSLRIIWPVLEALRIQVPHTSTKWLWSAAGYQPFQRATIFSITHQTTYPFTHHFPIISPSIPCPFPNLSRPTTSRQLSVPAAGADPSHGAPPPRRQRSRRRSARCLRPVVLRWGVVGERTIETRWKFTGNHRFSHEDHGAFL